MGHSLSLDRLPSRDHTIDINPEANLPEVNLQHMAFLSQPDPPVPLPFALDADEADEMPQDVANIKPLLEPALGWAKPPSKRGQARWRASGSEGGGRATSQSTKRAALCDVNGLMTRDGWQKQAK